MPSVVTITQTPAAVNLSQSPIVYSVRENDADILTSSSFQYVLELSYWTGSVTDVPTEPNYTLQKFPNQSSRGIFDVSRILTSVFTDLRAEYSSSVYHFRAEAHSQWRDNPTGSLQTGSSVTSATKTAIDGYQIFQEQVGDLPSDNNVYWPLMTDGPASQSFLDENYGRLSVWRGTDEDATFAIYSGSDPSENQSVALPTTSTNTTASVVTIPWLPTESDFPLDNTQDYYDIFLISGSNQNDTSARVTDTIRITRECDKKYDNIRIKWKNRYGQFDYFNFNLVSRESFKTQRSTYQPQIGSWDGTALSYQKYESSIQNYITDSTLKLTVNSDYVPESYNDIFKQLMVSDEIYWVYDEANDYVRPLAIDTTNFNIKTNVVDKLIQYSFSFTQGQGYKLIF